MINRTNKKSNWLIDDDHSKHLKKTKTKMMTVEELLGGEEKGTSEKKKNILSKSF